MNARRTGQTYVMMSLLFMAAGCNTTGPFYGRGAAPRGAAAVVADSARAPQHTVYLIGDAGDAQDAKPVLRLLASKLEARSTSSTVVFLGDNIYPSGLPAPGAEGRADAERNLDAQLRALSAHDGRAVFLPGNHDWDGGGEGGWAAVRRQEAYVEKHDEGRDVSFLPGDGCPGPVEVPLGPNLTLLALDTAWWLYPHDKPTPATSNCPNATEAAFLAGVDSLLSAQAAGPTATPRRVLVAAHHPLYSSGPHGGGVPYPLLTPFGPLYRLFSAGRQDLFAGRYEALREALLERFNGREGLIYAAGHDHSLQYHCARGLHYLVSGSGAKVSDVARTKTTAFAYARRGFLELTYYQGGRVGLRAWVPQKIRGGRGERPAGHIAFQADIVGAATAERSAKLRVHPDFETGSCGVE